MHPSERKFTELAQQDRPLSGRSDFDRLVSGQSDRSSHTPIVEILDDNGSRYI